MLWKLYQYQYLICSSYFSPTLFTLLYVCVCVSLEFQCIIIILWTFSMDLNGQIFIFFHHSWWMMNIWMLNKSTYRTFTAIVNGNRYRCYHIELRFTRIILCTKRNEDVKWKEWLKLDRTAIWLQFKTDLRLWLLKSYVVYLSWVRFARIKITIV